MNISNNREVIIFRNEHNGNVFYNVGLSKKLQDGSYENGSMLCQFKKDVQLANKTKIDIKSAWLSFYKKDKVTVPFIFINEFQEIKNLEVKEETKSDPYQEFNDSIELSESDLPF